MITYIRICRYMAWAYIRPWMPINYREIMGMVYQLIPSCLVTSRIAGRNHQPLGMIMMWDYHWNVLQIIDNNGKIGCHVLCMYYVYMSIQHIWYILRDSQSCGSSCLTHSGLTFNHSHLCQWPGCLSIAVIAYNLLMCAVWLYIWCTSTYYMSQQKMSK